MTDSIDAPESILTRILRREGGTLADLKAALAAGASPDIRVDGTRTALMYACEEFVSSLLVDLFLKHGAQVDARDPSGQTVLARYLTTPSVTDCVATEADEAELTDPEENPSTHIVEIFHLLLDAGADVNARDNEGKTPLFGCAKWHRETFFVRELLQHGADPDIRDISGHTALTMVAGKQIQNRDTKSAFRRPVAQLLAEHTSRDIPVPEDGWTPFVAALNVGNVPAIQALVSTGHPITLPLPFAHLEPVAAAVVGDIERLEAALRSGCDLEVVTANHRTALMWAAELGNLDMVRFLVNTGAELERTDAAGWTALFFAVLGGRADVCRYLLDCGADPNRRVGSGELGERNKTALRLGLELNQWDSRYESHRAVCRVLWDNNPDLSDLSTQDVSRARMREFLRPLWEMGKPIGPRQAAVAGELDLLRDLLVYGRDNDEGEEYYDDALGMAVELQQHDAVALMLSFGYDVNAGDWTNGQTPLMRAARQGDADLVRRLLEAGADPKIESVYGNNAISTAEQSGHPHIVKIIEEMSKKHDG